MRRIEYLQLIANLFRFKSIYDEDGNEYVVFYNSVLDSVDNISDRTAFEAYENHVHLLNNLSEKEFSQCIPVAKNLGYALLCSLHESYPNKTFIVYVSIQKKDSMIIRFHQKWENEPPYYNSDSFTSEYEKVIKIE